MRLGVVRRDASVRLLVVGSGPGWPAHPYVAAKREMTPPLNFAGSLCSLACGRKRPGGCCRGACRHPGGLLIAVDKGISR